jgi:hypothetical protein
MTREHVPPAAVQETGAATEYTLEEWLARSQDDVLPGGTVQQGGVWTRGLCASCNNKTGSWYGNEYRGWVGRAIGILQGLPPLDELDAQDRIGHVEVRFVDVDPGAFVRQVLSLMCTVSGPWNLAGQHPEIRAMVLDHQPGALPEGMKLHLTLYCGPSSRIAGPSLLIDRQTRQWRWVLEVAYPPLATLLVLVGDAEPLPLLEISEFTSRAPGGRFDYQAVIDVGFGHTPLPGDYRPAGALRKEAGTSAPPD